MAGPQERLEFAPPPPRGLLRALALALLAHGLLLAALTWGVKWRAESRILSAEAELWASLPQESAPAPEPDPPPPPPPLQPADPPQASQAATPTPADIALEREREQRQAQAAAELAERQRQEQLDKARQEQARQERARAEEKQKKEKAEQAQREEKEKKAEMAEQAEHAKRAADQKKRAQEQARQIEEQRQKNLQRLAGMAGASGPPTATGSAARSAGPSASYAGRIRARIKPNIVFTEEMVGNPTAEVQVRTSPDGTIVARKITQSSGLAAWDEAVLRAIDKTEVLPRDVDGSMPSELVLVFRARD